jgi:hypothetical protein
MKLESANRPAGSLFKFSTSVERFMGFILSCGT